MIKRCRLPEHVLVTFALFGIRTNLLAKVHAHCQVVLVDISVHFPISAAENFQPVQHRNHGRIEIKRHSFAQQVELVAVLRDLVLKRDEIGAHGRDPAARLGAGRGRGRRRHRLELCRADLRGRRPERALGDGGRRRPILARRLAGSVPESLVALRRDLEQNFKSVLQSGLARFDLVTREEFDVQTGVLRRTREKLEELQRTVAELEAQLDNASTPQH